MKRPHFFWMKNFLGAYAQLHVNPQEIDTVVDQAYQSILGEPLKYYIISVVGFFFFEFIFPLFLFYFLPFSKLSENRRQKLVGAAQNHRFYPLRLVFLLCKTPLLCALQTRESYEV